MSERIFFAMVFMATLGAGVMAGFFFSFSTTVMAALARVPGTGGIAAMQAINVTVLNPLFFAAFFGTALFSIVLAVAAFLGWSGAQSFFLLFGAAFYVIGTFLVTIVFNVPMNEALARTVPESGEAAQLWSNYLVRWTAWNHVRTASSSAALACFALALYARG